MSDRAWIAISVAHMVVLVGLFLLGIYVDWRFLPPAPLLGVSLVAIGYWALRREGVHR